MSHRQAGPRSWDSLPEDRDAYLWARMVSLLVDQGRPLDVAMSIAKQRLNQRELRATLSERHPRRTG